MSDLLNESKTRLSSEKSRRQIKLLPREHGATAIWFSSLLLAFGTLQGRPWPLGVVLFTAASVLLLILTGWLTNGSIIIIRLQRNRSLLPVLSSLLTLIVPLGQIVIVGQLSRTVLAAWFVFLTYCSTGVVYTQDLVRSVLKEVPPTRTSFILSAVIIVVEVATLNVFNWLSIAAVAIVVPLIVNRVFVLLPIQRRGSSRAERIREVGFAQTGNLIAAVLILALVSRL